MIETKSQKSFGANAYVNRSYSWKTGRKGGEGGGGLSVAETLIDFAISST